jgi:hypothetical protein
MRITRALAILVLATIMAAGTAAVAFAQAPAPLTGPAAAAKATPYKARGEVTFISERGFRVKNLLGETETVVVDAKTRFRLPGRNDITFADLKIGDRVMVLGRTSAKSANEVYTARLVNIEPRRPRVHQAAGTVTASSAASLTIKNLRGQDVTFVINDKTRVVPKNAVIMVGDKVAVVGAQARGENDIVAKVITVRRAPAPKTL